MKSRMAMVALAVILCVRNAEAFVAAAVTAANTARDEAYKAFMKLQAVATVKALRDNYAASVRYYELYKQLNQGKGIVQRAMGFVGDVAKDNLRATQEAAMRDWVRDPGYNSDIEKYVRALDARESERVRHASQELTRYLRAHEQAVDLEKKAGSLSPSAAQVEALRAQAIEIQLLASLNTEMTQLLQHFQKEDADAKRQAAVEWKTYQDSLQNSKEKD